MEIIVLGPGCTKCKNVYSAVEKVVAEAGIEATLKKEEDIMEIMTYGIMTTPAIVVDGVVKIKGFVPSEAEIKKALGL
jgi:small redox-active disulfide protein 2